ncbi:hypothetical protein M918_14645 [Clostridium sp. BL8]|nr:hypothetical protein M918_14645 [Clostridium sp. BL8]
MVDRLVSVECIFLISRFLYEVIFMEKSLGKLIFIIGVAR